MSFLSKLALEFPVVLRVFEYVVFSHKTIPGGIPALQNEEGVKLTGNSIDMIGKGWAKFPRNTWDNSEQTYPHKYLTSEFARLGGFAEIWTISRTFPGEIRRTKQAVKGENE